MLFGDAEREYRNLKAQFEAGRLSEADFRARLEEMMLEDDQGRWWSIGYETGKWYYHDGEQWVRGDPPAANSTTTPGSVTAAAAADVRGVSPTGATVEPPGSATRNLEAGALGGAAGATQRTAATQPPVPVPPVASVAGSSDASATSGGQAQVRTQGRPKPILTLAIGALLVLILAAAAVMLLARSGPTAATADAGSGQAGGVAAVATTPPQVSPTAVAVVAALSTATSTPADTQSPTSLPAMATATPQPPAPTDTLPPPTATPTAPSLPDTPTPEPPTPTAEPPTPTAEPPTPTQEPPTPTVAATATRAPAPTPTRVPVAATPAATAAPAIPGLVTGFEQWGRWDRGNQPNGTFKQWTQEKHSGSASGRLDYKFPAVEENFVVFLSKPSLSIPSTPDALSIWVLGDGSGHFLNVWVQDAQGEVRQFHFGAVPEGGTWQKLTASLDTSAAWPQGHIPSPGPDNDKLDYPIRLYALVLDALDPNVPSEGTIYLDDIMAVSGQ